MIRRLLLTTLFCLWALPAWALATHHSPQETAFPNTDDPSVTFTLGGGGCTNGYATVTATYQDSTPGTTTSATHDGNMMDEIIENHVTSGGDRGISIYGIATGSSTSNVTVQVITTESMNQINFHLNQYCVVDQVTPTSATSTNTGSVTPATVTIVNSANGDLAFAGFVGHHDNDPTTMGDENERTNILTGANQVGATADEVASGANHVIDWGLNASGEWAIVGFSFNSAAVGISKQPIHRVFQ